MLDASSLKKRSRPAGPALGPGSPVDRVGKKLVALECAHLRARGYGQHIVIEPADREKPRDRDAIARLTALGEDIYGLSFRREEGGWEAMVLIDTLDELVWEMVAAVTPDPPEVAVEEPARSGTRLTAAAEAPGELYESLDLGALD